MSVAFKTIVKEVQHLTPKERIDLLQIISRSLSDVSQDNGANAFWTRRELEEHIRSQQAKPITDISSLKGDFWPADETVDEMIEYIYGQRREDRDESW